MYFGIIKQIILDNGNELYDEDKKYFIEKKYYYTRNIKTGKKRLYFEFRNIKDCVDKK